MPPQSTDYTPPKSVPIWNSATKQSIQYPALIPGYNPIRLATLLIQAVPKIALCPFGIGLDKDGDKRVLPISWKNKDGTWKYHTPNHVTNQRHTHIGIIPASANFAVIDVDEGGEKACHTIRDLLGSRYICIPSRSAGRYHMFIPLSDAPKIITGAAAWTLKDDNGDDIGNGEFITGSMLFLHYRKEAAYVHALTNPKDYPPLELAEIHEALGISEEPSTSNPQPEPHKKKKARKTDNTALHRLVTQTVYKQHVQLYGPITNQGGNTYRTGCPHCSTDPAQGDRFRIHKDFSGFACDKCFPNWDSPKYKANRNHAVSKLGIPYPFGSSKQAFHAFYFAQEQHQDLFSANDTWYHYKTDLGVWQPDELNEALASVRDMYPGYGISYCNGVLKYAAAGDGHYLAKRMGDLDANTDTVACGSGQVLKLLQNRIVITNAEPHMLLTKQLGAAPDTDQTRLNYWKDLILSWTGNEPAADCLQMVIGLALFGWATRHKIVLFMEGQTNTGKTTFAEAVKAAFGDYGIAADETFAANNPREKHLRQGSLHGKRLALIPDLGPGQKLDASMLKTVSGGDSLTGRKLNHDPFDFQPQCLILGASNDLPAPDKTDAALKDRLKVIPFERQFTKGHDMIPGLRTTLKTEYLGTIIEWARQGMESYLKNGQTFVWPDGVIARTSEFYQRIDPFEAWLVTVHTEVGNRELVATTRELFDHYNEYREAESLKPLKHQQGFGRKLTDRGFPMKQMRVPGRTGKKFRVGVSLYPVPTVPTNEIDKQYEISDNIGSSTTTENNKRSIQKKAGGYSGYKPDKCAGCGGQIMYGDGVQVEGQMYCSVECVKSPF